MNTTDSELLAELDRLVHEVIAPNAPKVDADGAFPRQSIDALANARLLAVMSAKAVGGLELGLPTAVQVVERVARACCVDGDVPHDALLRGCRDRAARTRERAQAHCRGSSSVDARVLRGDLAES